MGITATGTTLTATWAQAFGSDAYYYVQQWYYDRSASKLYLLAYLGVFPNTSVRRVIDFTTPGAPAGAAWTLSSPYATDVVATASYSSPTTGYPFGCTSMTARGGYLYFVHFAAPSGNKRVCLARISLGTGIIEYATAWWKFADSNVAIRGRNRGLVMDDDYAYALVYDDTSANWRIGKWALAGMTWAATQPSGTQPAGSMIAATAWARPTANTVDGSKPFAMDGASDGSLLVWYDDVNKVEKYSTANLSLLGLLDWTVANVASVNYDGTDHWELTTSAEGGAVRQLNLVGYTDGSSGIVDASRCTFLAESRASLVGETTPMELTLTLRDGFGQAATWLAGQSVRFNITTATRGAALDADDAALCATPGGAFRAAGVPVRQVDAVIDANGQAKVYFQSARVSTAATIEDSITWTYPIA